jgi:glycosyltransferase involved in cell wall biosynthesis
MRIAFATTFNARDVNAWSGTPFHMIESLTENGVNVDCIGSLKQELPPFFKLKQFWKKHTRGQHVSPRYNIYASQQYSKQVADQLKKASSDAVMATMVNPVAYLDCKQPIVLWTDALFAGLLGFYSLSPKLSAKSIGEGNEVTAQCLSRCALAIFSSDWAANSAIELYGMNKEKVKVVPFGANITHFPTFTEVNDLISRREKNKIKLLFLAKSWRRKGGDIVLAVAKALYEAGYPVELNIVGYIPEELNPIPPYIKSYGFVSKHTPEGRQFIQTLLAESHFLFVPSRAEAYGIVFCEANAYGVPCLTTHVGGIGTVIKDNINGKTFSLYATVKEYCDYIVATMQNRAQYESLAKSSYHEFETRLNWKVATEEVTRLINTL